MAADWGMIKTEYVTMGTPYKKLAKKHGVSERQLCRHAKEEDWVRLHNEYVDRVAARSQQNAENAAVDYAGQIYASAERLISKVNQLLELEEALAPRDVKSLSSTLMDLKAILDVKPQEEPADDSTVSVVFGGSAGEWAQ